MNLKMQNKTMYCCQSDNQLGLNSNSARLCNTRYYELLINEI